MDKKIVNVIGGGLAGCEAAWTLANNGISVNLYEMKPGKKSPAHHLDSLCELVCSNSLRSDDHEINLLYDCRPFHLCCRQRRRCETGNT